MKSENLTSRAFEEEVAFIGFLHGAPNNVSQRMRGRASRGEQIPDSMVARLE